MAKKNYVYLGDEAFIDNFNINFSDEFKTKYCTEDYTTYKINVNYGTFVGQVSGDTYPIEEIGVRNSGTGLFNNVVCSETMSHIYVDLSIPETVKRINFLGCQLMDTGNGGFVNQYHSYLQGFPVVVIPSTVDVIETNAFLGFQMVNVEDPSKYDNLTQIGASYINAYTYSDDNVFYKNSEHTILYGFIPSYIYESNWIVENVLTIPNTITEIYSFTGENKNNFSLIGSSLEKVVIPNTITTIGDKLTVMSDSTITFSYNGVDYTAAGTGSNDSYTDLNNVLNTAGITTDGLLNIVQA